MQTSNSSAPSPRSSSSRALAAGLLIAGLVAMSSPGSALRAQQPTFRAGVDLLTIDVTAVNRDGRAVRDLKPEDFTVTVGGQPRKVAAARFYGTSETPDLCRRGRWRRRARRAGRRAPAHGCARSHGRLRRRSRFAEARQRNGDASHDVAGVRRPVAGGCGRHGGHSGRRHRSHARTRSREEGVADDDRHPAQAGDGTTRPDDQLGRSGRVRASGQTRDG